MPAISCQPDTRQSIGIGTFAQRVLIIGFDRHRDPPKLPGQCVGNRLNGSQPSTFQGSRSRIATDDHFGPHTIVIPMQVVGAKSPVAVYFQITLFKQTVDSM